MCVWKTGGGEEVPTARDSADSLPGTRAGPSHSDVQTKASSNIMYTEGEGTHKNIASANDREVGKYNMDLCKPILQLNMTS